MTTTGVSLDLVKRALVAAGACRQLHAAWWIHELGGLADVLARVPPDFNFKGAPHVARNLWLLSRQVDGLIDGIDTATLGLDAAPTEVRADLENWAQIIEGATEPGRSRRERIFRLPGWLITERGRLTNLKPGTSITESQSFAVDDIGVSWSRHRRQEQNFGGKYVLPLRHREPSKDGHPRIRSWYNTSGGPDTWQSIEARAYAHYRGFVQAVRDTRVFAAMEAIGRDDLRTALWLSHRRFRGQRRRLQFAEMLPELAAQWLPLPHESSVWHRADFRDAWRCFEREANLCEIATHVWISPRPHSPSQLQTNGVEEPVMTSDLRRSRLGLVDQRQADPAGINAFRCQQSSILEAWDAIDPENLRDQTRHHPRRLLEVVSLAMRLCWEMGGWIPAWVVVRAILATGLEAALRDATPDRLQGLRYLVDAWCYRVFRPQLDLAAQSQGHPPFRSTRGNDTVRRLVASWLTLRFAPDVGRRGLARELPATAEMAKGRRPPTAELRDFFDWSRDWHLLVATTEAVDRPEPADLEIGASGEGPGRRSALSGGPVPHQSVLDDWNAIGTCLPVWLHDFHPANGLMEQLYIEFHGRELSTALHSPAPFRS